MHVAACCLYLANRAATFLANHVERGLILAGGAAGIGAAFNAPIAGLVFAIEEIGRSFEKDNASLHRAHRRSSPACCASPCSAATCSTDTSTSPRLTPRAWLWFPVIGVAGGLLGGALRARRGGGDAARRAPRIGAGRTWSPVRSAWAWRCSA